MKWEKFIEFTGGMPVIDTENLLAGVKKPDAIQVQLSRWKKAGKIYQLKRGFYLLNEKYRKIELYEPFIASVLKWPSYISMEKALEYHGLIPESVNAYTCITTKRPDTFSSSIGIFEYRHINTSLFWGYNSVTVKKQTAFFASPEKSLLDFFYLNRTEISLDYLHELRLQNVSKINLNRLSKYAERFRKSYILSAAETIKKYIKIYKKEEKYL